MEPIIANLALRLGGRIVDHILAPPPPSPHSGAPVRSFESLLASPVRTSTRPLAQAGDVGLIAEARRTLSDLQAFPAGAALLRQARPGEAVSLTTLPDGSFSLSLPSGHSWSIQPESPAYSLAAILRDQLDRLNASEPISTLPGPTPDPAPPRWSISW